jgi:beta-lactamase regulating signal transducer with metallopeptidase domain
LLLKKDTLFTFNRHFLLFGILAATCIPFLEFTKTILLETPALELSKIPITSAQTASQADLLASENKLAFSLENILGIIYVFGVLVLSIRFLYQLFSLWLFLKKYAVQKVNGLRLIEVPEAISPFSFFNYMVYNPNTHPKGELDMILKHEKVHIRQHHSLDILISNLLVIVQWFNPLAWGYKKSIEENLEFIADRNTAEQVHSKKEYQLALVKASFPTVLPALTNHFYKSFIKKRIIMLNKTNSNRRSALKATLILPLLAVFLWSFNVKEETKYVEISAQTNPAETIAPKKQESETKPLQKKAVLHKASSEKAPTTLTKTEKTVKAKTPLKDKYRVKINKNTTDAELKAIKENVKANYGITFNYATTRNDKNEIISINISYSGNGNNGNYQISQDSAIDEFYFFVDDNGKTGFWSEAAEKRRKKHAAKRKMMMEKRNTEMEERREEMKVRQKKMHERFEDQKEEMKERREAMEDRKQAMKARMETRMHDSSNSGTTTERTYQNDSKYTVHSATDAQEPLYYVDGKEISKKELQLIPAKNIDKVNVLKGKMALKKYGGKGVNGVVEITTKK